jgi:ubiquinone/menaquinone biosynthesis C-methylase UbiE
MNRVLFLQELGQKWLPSIPDVDERLRSGRPARIADIGTGVGWASIGMARAYPNAQVDGFDLDGPSIEQARRNVAGTEVADRVRFFESDAAALKLDEHYDLVTALECVHDMADPVGVLATMRRLAGPDGAVLVMDERVADRFMDDGNGLEAFYYGFSVLHCLPAGMAESSSAGTGTVMRADTLRRYALEAGFRQVEVLPIDNVFFRVYRLHS